jgi:YebC/PmpR family DNA-binding regulatory protein
MSGHSKWHSIRHKKAAVDAKRGKKFTKIIKEITVAARMGGGDAESNPRLRTAILAARDANMPKDNIDKAIKRGTGELEGVEYVEVQYEGYGPGGVAIFIEAMTDNRNRTTAEIRHQFVRHNSNLGEAGCVSWMFTRKGVILVNGEGADEDALMEVALDAGAEDLINNGDSFTIYVTPNEIESVRKAIEDKGFTVNSAEEAQIPNTTVNVDKKGAESLLKLLAVLEDHEDVQRVSANFDISDEVLEEIGSQ